MSILPDSRLQAPKGTVMVDWPLPGGKSVRVEAEPVFCANCGVPYGYVPKENTSFTFWLCSKCFETYGAIAGTYAQPDDKFNRNLQEEMEVRFGRDLTAAQIAELVDQGRLGSAMEKLLRESPYPSADHRSRRT